MSVIGGMDDTIAKTMAEIGWPGADLVQPEGEEHELVDDSPADDQVEDLEEPESIDSDDESGAEDADSNETSDDEKDSGEPEAKEPTYRPKWKKAALAELDKLDPEVQAAFIAEDKRREENFHKGIEQYRAGNAASKEWDDVITPYRATIDQFQVKPQEAVKQLLATDHVLRYGQPAQKIGTLLQVMQGYGISPNDIVAVVQHAQGQSGEQSQSQEYQALNQRLQRFEQQQQNQYQQAEQARMRAEKEQNVSVNGQIEAFAADPDHEHFETLRPMMAGLLQSGSAKDLQEAYDMALKSHPSTANIWIAQQQKEWADARKAAATKAKKVTNVRSNGRASASSPNRSETMDETIARVSRELGLT